MSDIIKDALGQYLTKQSPKISLDGKIKPHDPEGRNTNRLTGERQARRSRGGWCYQGDGTSTRVETIPLLFQSGNIALGSKVKATFYYKYEGIHNYFIGNGTGGDGLFQLQQLSATSIRVWNGSGGANDFVNVTVPDMTNGIYYVEVESEWIETNQVNIGGTDYDRARLVISATFESLESNESFSINETLDRVSTVEADRTPGISHVLYFGSNSTFSSNKVWDVIYYSAAIGGEYIKELHWNCQEESGSIAYDVSGNGNHGTITGLVHTQDDSVTFSDADDRGAGLVVNGIQNTTLQFTTPIDFGTGFFRIEARGRVGLPFNISSNRITVVSQSGGIYIFFNKNEIQIALSPNNDILNAITYPLITPVLLAFKEYDFNNLLFEKNSNGYRIGVNGVEVNIPSASLLSYSSTRSYDSIHKPLVLPSTSFPSYEYVRYYGNDLVTLIHEYYPSTTLVDSVGGNNLLSSTVTSGVVPLLENSTLPANTAITKAQYIGQYKPYLQLKNSPAGTFNAGFHLQFGFSGSQIPDNVTINKSDGVVTGSWNSGNNRFEITNTGSIYSLDVTKDGNTIEMFLSINAGGYFRYQKGSTLYQVQANFGAINWNLTQNNFFPNEVKGSTAIKGVLNTLLLNSTISDSPETFVEVEFWWYQLDNLSKYFDRLGNGLFGFSGGTGGGTGDGFLAFAGNGQFQYRYPAGSLNVVGGTAISSAVNQSLKNKLVTVRLSRAAASNTMQVDWFESALGIGSVFNSYSVDLTISGNNTGNLQIRQFFGYSNVGKRVTRFSNNTFTTKLNEWALNENTGQWETIVGAVTISSQNITTGYIPSVLDSNGNPTGVDVFGNPIPNPHLIGKTLRLGLDTDIDINPENMPAITQMGYDDVITDKVIQVDTIPNLFGALKARKETEETINNITLFKRGVDNLAPCFTSLGGDQRVVASSATSQEIKPDAGEYTIVRFWFKSDTNKAQDIYFSYSTGGPILGFFKMSMDASGHLVFHVNSGSGTGTQTVATSGSYGDATWHFVEIEIDKSEITALSIGGSVYYRFFVDKVEVGTDTTLCSISYSSSNIYTGVYIFTPFTATVSLAGWEMFNSTTAIKVDTVNLYKYLYFVIPFCEGAGSEPKMISTDPLKNPSLTIPNFSSGVWNEANYQPYYDYLGAYGGNVYPDLVDGTRSIGYNFSSGTIDYGVGNDFTFTFKFKYWFLFANTFDVVLLNSGFLSGAYIVIRENEIVIEDANAGTGNKFLLPLSFTSDYEGQEIEFTFSYVHSTGVGTVSILADGVDITPITNTANVRNSTDTVNSQFNGLTFGGSTLLRVLLFIGVQAISFSGTESGSPKFNYPNIIGSDTETVTGNYDITAKTINTFNVPAKLPLNGTDVLGNALPEKEINRVIQQQRGLRLQRK